MRKDIHEYFLSIAKTVSERASCDRKLVGCVLVRDRNILATGYNGSIAGLPHCDQVGHDMDEGHCVRTVHAEMNALMQAAKHGHSVKGATAYLTCSPCWLCFKLLINAGITEINFSEEYRGDKRIGQALNELKWIWPLDYGSYTKWRARVE